MDYNISYKTNRVLNVILLGLILILVRIWYLTVVQHEDQLRQARKPQRRTIIEQVERATIRDRFNIPLAFNKIQYNAAITYAHLRQIPTNLWQKDESGKRVRVQARMDYIGKLSKLLAEELEMDPQRIEDMVYGKASLFPHTPFVIKEDISERQYFRLRMLEKDWLGLQTQRSYKRSYPLGKVGCDIIGYMGAINQKEYLSIAQEIETLHHYLEEREAGENPMLPKGFNSPLAVRDRLKALQEKAYTINDLVGKAGIEGGFDEQLRGYFGKKIYEVDVKGNSLRELPGSRPTSGGKRVILTISSELQAAAEELLAQHERTYDQKAKHWIKGSSIVAMIPQTGEVVALASYPRVDPNDFVPVQDLDLRKQRQAAILHWLENEDYVGEMWDGKRLLEKECFSFAKNRFYDEKLFLTWENYLDFILPEKGQVRAAIEKIDNIQNAYHLQQTIERLLTYSRQTDVPALIQSLYAEKEHKPLKSSLTEEQRKQISDNFAEHAQEVADHKKFLDSCLADIPFNNDKMLVIDLCRMLVDKEVISEPLLQAVGRQSLSTLRALGQAATILQSALKTHLQELHHDLDFTEWRAAHFKEFLREMRKKEKAQKKYTRPYTDYLDITEKRMFREFWKNYRWVFVEAFITGDHQNLLSGQPQLQPYFAHLMLLRAEMAKDNPQIQMMRDILVQLPPELTTHYLKLMRSFEELDRPLLGHYRHLRHTQGQQLEKHLAAAFYPVLGYGYGRSQAFRQSTPAGSVFKLVVAYEALRQLHQSYVASGQPIGDLNPLTMIDEVKWDTRPGKKGQIVGYRMDGTPITRVYKGGRLPRSSRPDFGQIDMIGALEKSSNPYFSLLASEHMYDPNCIANAARLFGYGEKTGIELPGEIIGNIPDDLPRNPTGLYSTAIGQHSLVVTPLQTAQMIAAIANQGKLVKPKIVQLIAGKELSSQDDLFSSQNAPFQDDLKLIGIDFPLFTELQGTRQHTEVIPTLTEIKRDIFFPDDIHKIIIEGMKQVINGPRGTARPSIMRGFHEYPGAVKDYVDLRYNMAAKTGTAEILYKHSIDAETEAEMEKHVWFAGISYPPPPAHLIGKEFWGEPDLVVVVYLRFGGAGRDCAPLATQVIKKWREIKSQHNKSK